MMNWLMTLIFVAASLLTAQANAESVRVETSLGDIVIELNREKAPVSVENFLKYVNQGFYNGTVFHRVIKGFMIQGGGFTQTYQKKQPNPPIKIEADNGLKNTRGSVAMARTMDPNSATAQFFINVVDNGFLNHRDKSIRGWGYAVFGKVTEGMDIVDKIRAVQTGPGGPFPKNVPKQPVIIKKVSVISK